MNEDKNKRKDPSIRYCGFRHHLWKGGIIEMGPYLGVYHPEHPRAHKKGYILQHRAVYEDFYKCCLLEWADVHHINGNKRDNRITNLMVTSRKTHLKLHRDLFTKDLSGRHCIHCGSLTTRINEKGNPCWYRLDDSFICRNCYERRRIKAYRY